MRKIRLLPAVIFFAGLTLTVKLGALWQDVEFVFFAPAVAESKAAPEKQEAKAKGDAKAAAGDNKSEKPEDQKLAKVVDKNAKPDGAANSETEKAAEDKPKGEKGFDPALATDAEVEIARRDDQCCRRGKSDGDT